MSFVALLTALMPSQGDAPWLVTPATSTFTSVKSTCQSRSFGAKKAMSSVETVVLRIEASMRTSPMKSLYCAHESPASETNGKLTFERGVMIEAFSKPRQPCVM